MYERILPLLIQYLTDAGYKDPLEGVYLILGDYKKSDSAYQFIQKESLNPIEIFGGNLDLKEKNIYYIQPSAFYQMNSYLELL
jgi:5-methylcytosine-specific restriction protein B